jgi:antitoxin (DNA-binding transcriptional repressor) of toxin-antitoxin stability system
MKDHMDRTARAGAARGVVGVRELKTHTARIVRHVREARASYIVTHRGRAVGVMLPLDPAEGGSPASEHADGRAAWEAFVRAGRRIERRFRPGVSGVRLLSEMRR